MASKQEQLAFIEKAKEHYTSRLNEEKERWGVRAVSSCWCEHDMRYIANLDIWDDLNKQMEQTEFLVQVCMPDIQEIGVIIAQYEVPNPVDLTKLALLVEELNSYTIPLEMVEVLEVYDGPYELEVPEELLEDAWGE